ncbi:MAG: hypothetical protein R2784_18190 [Saprospiraceae bacterium]
MTKQGGAPIFQNDLKLDLEAIKWFSQGNIEVIYIKNNISNQMRKFTVNPNRQAEFGAQAMCFYQKLDKSMIKSDEVVGVDLSGNNRPISSTSGSKKPISSTPVSAGGDTGTQEDEKK